ncbi:MAG: hypothetical protein Q9167_000856 [Letrouitia subvulpina]
MAPFLRSSGPGHKKAAVMVPKKVYQLWPMAAIIASAIFLYYISKSITSLDRPQTGGIEEVLISEAPTFSPSQQIQRFNHFNVEEPPRIPMSSNLRPGRAVATEPNSFNVTWGMVVPRVKNEDISWIANELPGLSVTVYTADDINASKYPPKNKGHEVMIYLSYIIDHYSELPDVVLFMHAHRWTHHNNEFLGFDASQMIRRLSHSYVSKRGYMNMRCHWQPGCPEWLHPVNAQETIGRQEEAVLARCWSELFPFHPPPPFLAQACCAQFALSKERILSIPLSRYVFYRDWILRTPLSDYVSGRIWEYSWQFVFANRAADCPAEHACYCAGFGVCFGGEGPYKDYLGLLRRKRMLEGDLEKLEKEQPPKISPGLNGTDNALGSARKNRTSTLRREIDNLAQELSTRKEEALRRGDDFRIRAEEDEMD